MRTRSSSSLSHIFPHISTYFSHISSYSFIFSSYFLTKSHRRREGQRRGVLAKSGNTIWGSRSKNFQSFGYFDNYSPECDVINEGGGDVLADFQ